MSDQNQAEGKACYETGCRETRAWFEHQWSVWPTRADERKTTNISFLYGGVTAYRADASREPTLSADFRSHVDWLDKHQPLATSRSQHEGASS